MLNTLLTDSRIHTYGALPCSTLLSAYLYGYTGGTGVCTGEVLMSDIYYLVRGTELDFLATEIKALYDCNAIPQQINMSLTNLLFDTLNYINATNCVDVTPLLDAYRGYIDDTYEVNAIANISNDIEYLKYFNQDVAIKLGTLVEFYKSDTYNYCHNFINQQADFYISKSQERLVNEPVRFLERSAFFTGINDTIEEGSLETFTCLVDLSHILAEWVRNGNLVSTNLLNTLKILLFNYNCLVQSNFADINYLQIDYTDLWGELSALFLDPAKDQLIEGAKLKFIETNKLGKQLGSSIAVANRNRALWCKQQYNIIQGVF